MEEREKSGGEVAGEEELKTQKGWTGATESWECILA